MFYSQESDWRRISSGRVGLSAASGCRPRRAVGRVGLSKEKTLRDRLSVTATLACLGTAPAALGTFGLRSKTDDHVVLTQKEAAFAGSNFPFCPY